MRNQNNTWIESVPKDWAIGRISYKYQVQLGKMLQPEPISIFDIKKPYLRSANLDWHGVKLEDVKEMWFSPNDLKKYKIEPSDVLVSEGGDVGRTSFWNESIEMYIQNAVNRLRPLTEESNPKFLFYWFSFLKTHGLIDIMCDSSTISHYTAEKVKATQLVFPTFSEQTLIARFLDQKTSQIDRLIEQKEKLLKLLAEKRTAIITQAVTKGLDPNAEMKDSGIEWLGEIPKHWEVIPLKYKLNSLNRRRIPLSAEERVPMSKNFPYYGASGIIDYVEDYIFEEDLILIAEDGANLLSRSTPLAFVATGKYWVNNHAHILESDSKTFGFWSNLLCLIDYTPWITGAAQPKLTKENLGSIPLPKPPEKEQLSIAEFVTMEIGKYDPLIDKVKCSINQLKEYREAIINAAVTGQIDLRKEVSNG